MIEHLYPWIRSWRRTPLQDRAPWLPFPAVDRLEEILKSPARIFEFGSGGSTFFFASRGHRVITIEHDRKWYERISEKIAEEGFSNAELLLMEPAAILFGEDRRDPSDPALYQSGLPRYRGVSFYSYAAAIDGYPDGFFDLVLIDGRARPSCMKHAAPKVRLGGFLVLDDADRPRYHKAQALFAPPLWKVQTLRGLRPYPFQGVRGLRSYSFREFPVGSTAIRERCPAK